MSSSCILFHRDYFKSQADDIINLLTDQIHFPSTRPIITGGVNIPEPRDVCFFGEPFVQPMQYSGLQRAPQPMVPVLVRLLAALAPIITMVKDKLRLATLHYPNCVLVNRYTNGTIVYGYPN